MASTSPTEKTAAAGLVPSHLNVKKNTPVSPLSSPTRNRRFSTGSFVAAAPLEVVEVKLTPTSELSNVNYVHNSNKDQNYNSNTDQFIHNNNQDNNNSRNNKNHNTDDDNNNFNNNNRLNININGNNNNNDNTPKKIDMAYSPSHKTEPLSPRSSVLTLHLPPSISEEGPPSPMTLEVVSTPRTNHLASPRPSTSTLKRPGLFIPKEYVQGRVAQYKKKLLFGSVIGTIILLGVALAIAATLTPIFSPVGDGSSNNQIYINTTITIEIQYRSWQQFYSYVRPFTPFQPTQTWLNNYYRLISQNATYRTNLTLTDIALTQFADLSQDDFANIYTNTAINATARANLTVAVYSKIPFVPSSLSWVGVDVAVSPVKNQLLCGACWAFTATEAIESAFGTFTNTPIQPLSVQQIISCDTGGSDYGCKGGDPVSAIEGYLIRKNQPLTTEAVYPFNLEVDGAGQGSSSCSHNLEIIAKEHKGTWQGVVASQVIYAVPPCTSKKCLWSYSQELSLLYALYTTGPVIAAVDAHFWEGYIGGIVDGLGSDPGGTICTGASGQSASYARINHVIQIVGFTSTYWIVKNQWGTFWGDKGFIYIARGSNTCCILCEAVQVVIQQVTPNNPSNIVSNYSSSSSDHGSNQTINR